MTESYPKTYFAGQVVTPIEEFVFGPEVGKEIQDAISGGDFVKAANVEELRHTMTLAILDFRRQTYQGKK